MGIWAAGVPETLTREKLAAVNPILAEIAETAVFLASDHVGGITGTFVNATGGMVSVWGVWGVWCA